MTGSQSNSAHKTSDSVRRFSAPGRVNLMGDHTDYNEGYVLPAAIDRRTRVQIRPRSDGRVRAVSRQFSGVCEFDLCAPPARPFGDWGDYVRGVFIELLTAGGPSCGFDLEIDSDVPAEAGLSSSAALEVVCGFAALTMGNGQVDLLDLARVAHRAESIFVGTRCGLMDQLIACFGQSGCAILIDCRVPECRAVALPPCLSIVIANTMARRSLVASDYNLRRAECEAAVRELNRSGLAVSALRDVSSAEALAEGSLPALLMRRSRHVVTENARVLAMAAALESQDLNRAGRLMAESHCSLRDDYEVSCKELDLMVDLAAGLRGFVGARMTGGGFGGCTVNLVMRPEVERFRDVLGESYLRATGITPEVYVCEASQGVREEGGRTVPVLA